MKNKSIILILLLVVFCSCTTKKYDEKYRTEGKYIFGYKHGIWKEYYFDKTLKQTVNFSWDKMDGDYISYHQVNMLKDRLMFDVSKVRVTKNGKTGPVEIIIHRGNINLKIDSITQLPIREIGVFEDGIPVGEFVSYDVQGFCEKKIYKNGKVRSLKTYQGDKFISEKYFDQDENEIKK